MYVGLRVYIELTGDDGASSGNEKLSSGQPAEAIEFYNKAIALNPNNAVYYGNRCVACIAGDYGRVC